MKKILNKGNQIYNFISSSGSGSASQKSYGSYGSGSGSTTLFLRKESGSILLFEHGIALDQDIFFSMT